MKNLFIAITVSLLFSFSAVAQNWNIGLTAVNETCFGANDGEIELVLTGSGVSGYSFTWEVFESADLVNPYATGTVDNPFGTNLIDGLFQDDWTVTVTRSTANTPKTRTSTITVGGSASLLSVTKTVLDQNLCNGDASGSVQVSATGGTAPYEYGLGIGAGATSPTYSGGYTDNGGLFESLAAATYVAFVRDANGCVKANASGDFQITQPSSITIDFDTVNADCNNQGGQIIINSISGGTPYSAGAGFPFNFEIEWQNAEDASVIATNVGAITGLDSGSYQVIVTDKNGCTGSTQMDIYKGFNFVVNDQQDVTCTSDNDGTIQVRLDTDTEDDESPFELRIYDGDMVEITLKRQTGVAVGTADFTGLGPDTYTIRAFGQTGCTLDVEATLAEPETPQLVSATQTPVICKTDATGAITFVVTGGSGSYSYSVDGGANYFNTPTIGNLTAGLYDLWIQDSNGCPVDVADKEVTEPIKQWGMSFVSTSNITCAGAGNGAYTWEFDTGLDTDPVVEADNIVWVDVNSGETVATGLFSKTDLEEGEYRIDVTANSGCYRSLTFNISEPAVLAINGVAPEFLCPADLSPDPTEINVSVTGGTTPYTFEWKRDGGALGAETVTHTSPTSKIEDVTNDHVYSFHVTDAEGCTTSKSFDVTIPDPITIALDAETDIACKNETTGSIGITVTGGTPTSGGSYFFNWAKDGAPGYANTEDISNLGPGTYQVTIIDDNGCEKVDPNTYTITEPATTYALSGTITDVVCNGANDGKIVAVYTPDSGHPNVASVTWTKDGAAYPAGTGLTTITGLAPGTYVMTTIDNTYACSKSISFDVLEYPVLSVNPTVTQNECFGDANGVIDISPSGGLELGTFTVRWTRNNVAQPAYNDLLSISGLDDATYRVTVTDDLGCAKSSTIVMASPDELIATAEIVNVACKGESTGSIDVTITGGVSAGGTYDLVWTKDGGSFAPITEDLSNLAAGVYQLTITDDNGCVSDPFDFTVTQPSTTYSISGVSTPVTCNGANDGTIDITVNLGSPTHPNPTDITWTKDGVFFVSNTLDLKQGDLEPGTYELTTVDTYGCSRSLSFDIVEYPELVMNPTITQNECFGDETGSIEIDPSGGYLGSNISYSIRWYKDGTAVPSKNNQTSYTSLADGVYRVVLSDYAGCTMDSTITLEAPEPVSATANVQEIKCRGDETGYIALDITGGTSPYIITWKENDASGASFSSADSIFDLAPGSYFVTIEDQNDCDPFTATYVVTQPATDFNISLDPTEIKCTGEKNAAISLVIDAGAGHPDSYSLTWYKNGDVLSSQTGVGESGIVPIQNLGPATYSVVVTDANGCERTDEYIITNPTKIYFRPEISSVTCNGYSDGSITLDPTGGYGNYTVSWKSEAAGNLSDTDFDLGDIPAGKYTATLTDSEGCQLDTVIFMDDPLPIVVTSTIKNTSCVGGSDGAVTITTTNGTPPYSYQWLLDGKLISTGQNITDLEAATYQLIVTDQFQCQYNSSDFTVADPPSEFFIDGTITRVTCHDDFNGEIDVEVQITGEPDLDYSVYWEKNGVLFSQNTEDLNGIGAGTYEIFIEDEYGCIKSKTFSLENPDELAFVFDIVDVSCFGGSDGSVSAQVSGGYGTYQFSWLKDGLPFTATSSFATNLEAAFYRVTVTDLEGCVLTRTVEVAQPDPFRIAVTSVSNTCATPYDSEIDATVTGGIMPYSLQWLKDGLPYSKQEDLAGIPAGVYQLLAVDSNFCETASVEVTITSPERLGVDVITQKNNLCPNTENGAITFQGTGGSFPYTYSFDSGDYASKNNFVNLAGRKYLVSVLDDVGCTFDTLLTIDTDYELEAEFSLETEEFAIDFPITLTDESLGQGIEKWFWDFGDTRADEKQNTTVTYTTPGVYVLKLTVENEVGCTLSKTDTLEIVQGYNFAVPTAFTPNGDGSNENFRPGFQNVKAMTMRVQDRNGLLVFESEELSASWDGKFNGHPVPQGPYYYEITYTAKSGVTRKHAGKIFVLR